MNYADFAAVPFLAPLGDFLFPLLGLFVLWSVTIKGFALWKAARAGQTVWFIVLLAVNTVGLLELVYLIWFSKKSSKPTPVPGSSS